MSKQDSTFTRTAAELERKHNFGKKFSEILGLIDDTRDRVDEVESGLRSEIKEEATSIRRDTESIVANAVRDTVKTSEFEEYKESASAELKIAADGITAKVDSTTEQVTNISGDLSTVRNQLTTISEDLAALEVEVDNIVFDENGEADITESFRREVKVELDALDDRITAEVNARTEKTTQIDAELSSVTDDIENINGNISNINGNIDGINGNIDGINDSLDEANTNISNVQADISVLQKFKEESSAKLEVLSNQISAEVNARTEETTQIDAEINIVKGNVSNINTELSNVTDDISNINGNIDGINSDIDGINSDMSSVKTDISILNKFKEESSAELGVLSDRITAEVNARTENTTQINAEFAEINGNVGKITSDLSEITQDITGINGEIDGINGNIDGINTNIDGINNEIADVKYDISILEESKEESSARLDLHESQISAGVSRTEEVYTVVSGTIEDTKNDLAEEIDIRQRFQAKAESDLSLLSDSMTLNFEKTEEETTSIQGDLQKVIEKLEKHFEFSLDGLIIKAGSGSMELILDNDIIRFVKNGQEFGWWDGINFHTGNIKVAVNERAQFGNFAFVPRSNGSLSFLKVGDA